jgi:hypothetical protein
MSRIATSLRSANRRHFLRASGVSLALPLLESLPGRALSPSATIAALPGNLVGEDRPLRMVCIGNLLGFYPQAFFPTEAGSKYVLPKSVEVLEPHRNDFTINSVLSWFNGKWNIESRN